MRVYGIAIILSALFSAVSALCAAETETSLLVALNVEKGGFRLEMTTCAMQSQLANLSYEADPDAATTKDRIEVANLCRESLKSTISALKDRMRAAIRDPAKLNEIREWYVATTLAADSLSDGEYDPMDRSQAIWRVYDELLLRLEW